MAERPTIVFAMAPALTRDLLTDAHRARLATLAEVLDREPRSRFDDARAATLCSRAPRFSYRLGLAAYRPGLLDRAHALRADRARGRHREGTSSIRRASARRPRVFRGCRQRGARRGVHRRGDPARRKARVPAPAPVSRGARLPLLAAGGAGLGNVRRTVGIVGASRIGRLVLERLRGFDFERSSSIPSSRTRTAAALGAEKVGDLDRIPARAPTSSRCTRRRCPRRAT